MTLFLLLLAGPVFSQSPLVYTQVKDGKIIRVDSKGNELHTNESFTLQSSASGVQRTYTVNGLITLTVTTVQPGCGYSNGIIIVNATGGTAPYTYSDVPGFNYNSGNFPNLIAGTYNIVVTDATGQTATTSVVLADALPAPHISVASVVRVSTCNAGDGAVTLATTGGLPPYQYSLDLVNFQSSPTFTNLTLGIYRFYVKDANGCIASLSSFFNVDMAPFGGCDGVGSSHSETECNGEGQISVSGGFVNAPFTYSTDGINYSANNNFPNLPYGIYKFYIKNVLGQVIVFSFSIAHNCYVSLNYISVDAACQQNDGVLTVNVSNGTPPYTYTLDGVNYQSSNTFTGLASGRYNVTVRDMNGFTSSGTAFVYDRCPAVTVAATGETCAHNDGSITATATKGTAPYQYSLDGTNFQTSNIFAGLAGGDYTVTLKDALGFTTTATITVPFYCLHVTAVPTNVVCGNANGVITVTGAGGTAPYQYSLDGTNFQTSNIFNGLFAAAYTVTVKDLTGTTATTPVTITDAPRPGLTIDIVSPSCNRNDGIITLTAVGGTAPFQYSINNVDFFPTNVFTGVQPGVYTAAIKDANGCQYMQLINSVTAICPEMIIGITYERCNNADGALTIGASHGTLPFQYSLDGINYQTSNFFSGLTAGTYTVWIKDANGYSNSGEVEVGNTCPVVTAVKTDASCGNANGMITASGTGGLAPYQYSIDGINFQSSPVFTGLMPGTYTVTIKDTWWTSTNTTTVTIADSPAPQIITSATVASCLNNDGSITLTAQNGTAPFQYSINSVNFLPTGVFNNLASGDYTTTVKDVNGCSATQLVTVPMTNNINLQTNIDPTICEGEQTHLTIVTNATAFTWTPAGTLDNSHAESPLASPVVTTKYYVTADLGACSKIDSVLVTVNPAPVADAGHPITICKGQSTQLSGNGGTIYNWAPSTYLSDPGISNPLVASPLATITYTLNVTDANNCHSLQPSAVQVQVITTTVVFAGNDTSIVMNQPFQLLATDVNNSGFVNYEWSPAYGLDVTNSQHPVATLDHDMIYHITASTANGCEATDEIKIKVYTGPEIYVPTAFTPDHNGHNDKLRAIPVGIKKFSYFVVYNRWGQQVFYTTDPSREWDGTINGAEQPTGTFVWMAKGTDDKGNIIQRRGSVTLIR